MTARHKVSNVVQYGKLYFFDSENIFGSLRSLPTIKSQRPNKPAPLRSVPGSFPEIYIDLLCSTLHFILNSIFCTS